MTRAERLQQARESVEETALFSREHMGNKAILTKLYHAMMSCLFALLDIREIGRMTHEDVIDRFDREWIGPEKIDSSVLKALRRAYDLTHECECDAMPVPTDEETDSALKAVGLLIRTAEGELRAAVGKGRAA